MRDIKAMLDQLGMSEDGYAQNWTNPQNGQTYPEYRLPRDLTVTLITGYRADLRYKVIKRLEDRECQSRIAVPQSLPEALHLAADLADVIRRWRCRWRTCVLLSLPVTSRTRQIGTARHCGDEKPRAVPERPTQLADPRRAEPQFNRFRRRASYPRLTSWIYQLEADTR